MMLLQANCTSSTADLQLNPKARVFGTTLRKRCLSSLYHKVEQVVCQNTIDLCLVPVLGLRIRCHPCVMMVLWVEYIA